MAITEKQREIIRMMRENDLIDDDNLAMIAALSEPEEHEPLWEWMKQKKTFTYSEMMRMVMSIEFPELYSLEDT